MAQGAYVYRQEGDTENPQLARLIGRGITRGQDVLFRKNPATLLTILCEGARRDGDTDCVGAVLVTYRGFVVPEYENNVRNWRFHTGKMTAVPVYTTVTADHTTDKFTKIAHGLVNSPTAADTYRFIAEGPASINPKPPAGIVDETTQYYIVNKTANDFQLSLTVGGPAETFTDNGAGTFRVYRDNTGYHDPDQGRPDFFPDLDFTLSGICYLEFKAPTRFEEDFNPDDLRIILDGKKLSNFVYDEDGVISWTDPIASTNPALEMLDFWINDAKMPPYYTHLGVSVPRFRGGIFKDFQETCEELIEWEDGGEVAGVFEVVTNINAWEVDLTTGGLRSNNAVPADRTAYSRAIPSTDQNFSIEVGVAEAQIKIGLHTNNTDANPTSTIALLCATDGKLYTAIGATVTQIGTWSPGDFFTIASENRLQVWYQNDVPLTIGNHILPAATVYAYVHGSSGSPSTTSYGLFTPRSATAVTRYVKRFTSNVVYPVATLVQDAVDGVLRRCPSIRIQDVNGALKPLIDQERDHVFEFHHDTAEEVESNIIDCKMKQTSPEQLTNFYRGVIRDTDNLFLKQVPIFEDRKALREASRVGLVDSGLLTYGVMNQSEASRIIKFAARERSDLPITSSVQAFFQSYVAAKGDYVTLVDDVPGYSAGDPVLFIVNEESNVFDKVPIRNFGLKLTTKDVYQDEDHGPAVPDIPEIDNQYLRPAPLVVDIALSQSVEMLPTGQWVYSAVGVVEFDPFNGQTARLWRRRPTSEAIEFNLDQGDDYFYSVGGYQPFVDGDQVCVIAGDDPVPPDEDYDELGKVFTVVDADAEKFGISADFSTDANVRVHKISAWEPTSIILVPNQEQEAVFEIDASLGVHIFKAVTQNRLGSSFPFDAHEQYAVQIIPEVVIPQPPSNLRALFDGVNITFQFEPSISSHVSGYQVTDELGRIVRNLVAGLEFTETLSSDQITRRVYAVSNLGIRSDDYAELRFVRPPVVQFRNVTGATIDSNGVMVKTAADGWGNCGAVLDKLVLTDQVPASLTYAADTDDQFKIFGFTRNANCNSYDDFLFAVYFHDDGTLFALWDDLGSIQQMYIGEYEIGTKYQIEFIPGAVFGDSVVVINRLYETPTGKIAKQQLHLFEEQPHLFPSYCGVALYSQGSIFSPYFEVSGDVLDYEQKIPELQNLSGLTYNSGTGDVTTTATGHAGSVEFIPAYQDGVFRFKQQNLGGYFIGVSTTPLDNVYTDLPICFEFDTAYGVTVHEYGVSVATLPATNNASLHEWTLSRENGKVCLRREGKLVYVCSTSAALASEALYLVIISTDDMGTIYALRRQFAYETDTIAGNRVPITTTLEDPIIGKNRVTRIPEFSVESATPGQVLTFDADMVVIGATPTVGTVTSVGLTMPAIFSVTGSPVTSSGTFGVSLVTQTANKVLASAVSGGAATPAFRALVVADLPTTGLTGTFSYGNLATNDNDNSHKLTFRWAENSVADRILNLAVNGASRTINMSGDLTVSANATVSGTNTGDQVLTGLVPYTGATGNVTLGSFGITATSVTISGLTAGSVPFVSTAGLLAQDTANFVWDNTNKQLGIGISVPVAKIHVKASAAGQNLIVAQQAASHTGSAFRILDSGGSLISEWRTNSFSNMFIGTSAGSMSAGGSNMAVGSYAGQGMGASATNNVFIGTSSGYSIVSGTHNAFIGSTSGYGNTASANVAIGSRSLEAAGSVGFSVAIGYLAANLKTAGDFTVAIGMQSLYNHSTGAYNTALGAYSGFSNTTGVQNVFLGYAAGYSETGSHRLYIANSTTTTPLIYGEFDNALLRTHGRFEAVKASNATLTTFTQAVSANALTISSTYGAGNTYQPGLMWLSSDNNATKPKAGIWVLLTGSGSSLMFGTSSNYVTGITNTALSIDHLGNSTFSGYTTMRRRFRVYSTASTSTLTPEIDTYDVFALNALASALYIANHSTSTAYDGDQIRIRILDNGTARAISYGTNYVAKSGIALPTTTVISKNMEMLFEWNSNLSKYNLKAADLEA